eukprot:4191018-Amphidinium_carterae.1
MAPVLLKLSSKVLSCLTARSTDAEHITQIYPLLRTSGNKTWPPAPWLDKQVACVALLKAVVACDKKVLLEGGPANDECKEKVAELLRCKAGLKSGGETSWGASVIAGLQADAASIVKVVQEAWQGDAETVLAKAA